MLKVIEESGYNGWIGLEYKAKADTVKGLKWIEKFGYALWYNAIIFDQNCL